MSEGRVIRYPVDMLPLKTSSPSIDDLASLIARRLTEEREAIARQWHHPEGTSTRHFVVDDLLPETVCFAIREAFPRDATGFFARATFREKKKTLTDLSEIAPILSSITYAFQDQHIVDLVAQLTGLDRIQPDPKLYAGGISMMFAGDFLNPHIDNSHDAARRRYRRINLLYYVSPGWTLDAGGNFELWDARRKKPHTLVSRCNRLIVMETNKTSWHSVSPVVAPEPRCCVSNYYFSDVSPDKTEYYHVTSFSGRPGEKLKRGLGLMDNAIRNIAARTLKVGRGRNRVNRQDE